MVDMTLLADMINNELNALAQAANVGFTFDIKYARNKIDGNNIKIKSFQRQVIKGELDSLPSSIIPISGLDMFYSSNTLYIAVPRDQLQDVLKIVQSYVQSNTGKSFALNGYAQYAARGIYQMPTVEAPFDDISIEFGNIVTIQAEYLFIKDGVLANATVIELDGEEMFAINWDVRNDKTPSMNNVANSPILTAQIQAQSVQYSWITYYRNTPVIKEIIREIHGDKPLEQTHALVWYDGVTYTEQSPKSVTVRLLTSTYSGSAGDIPQIELHFTQATQIGNAADPPTL